MKATNLILGTLSLSAALLLAGCGGGSPTEVQQPQGADPAVAVTSITITGNDQMRFSPTEFTVKAGSEVEVVFHNIGRMPKETMGHNLVILQKGTNGVSFATASIRHPDNAYVAPELENQVIAHTAVLGPNERETLTFTVPSETGDYPFVCSFPGHTPAGMVGVMRVID
jgi:azurin